ncbi:MAG: acetate/propionate family kinase [Chloroflexota bacterium]
MAETTRLKRVLVLNAGSSSLKWSLLDADAESTLDEGSTTWEGAEHGRHASEVAAALRALRNIDAIGHRVVHGGSQFRQAVLVNDAVRREIDALSELAPLHNPAALAGIGAAAKAFPGAPQVAAFDTAFHATLPEAAAVYPIPWEWTERWGLRRFGFHGLSVQYAIRRASELLGCRPARLIVAHLGSGCSVTAVAEGRSVETSMGFTPLEGVMMASRSGSVDPGLMLHLLTHRGVQADDLDAGLNEQAGLRGVSGVSADLRKVEAAADTGSERASLAIGIFVHRLVMTIGGMAAALGGLDALVFTGGIGEHSARTRAAVCERLGHLGIVLDSAANDGKPDEGDIAAAEGSARVLVVAAREDLSVLTEVKRVLGASPGVQTGR